MTVLRCPGRSSVTNSHDLLSDPGSSLKCDEEFDAPLVGPSSNPLFDEVTCLFRVKLYYAVREKTKLTRRTKIHEMFVEESVGVV